MACRGACQAAPPEQGVGGVPHLHVLTGAKRSRGTTMAPAWQTDKSFSQTTSFLTRHQADHVSSRQQTR